MSVSSVRSRCRAPFLGSTSVPSGRVRPRSPFGSTLPAAPARAVTLQWLGGTYEAADLAGFHIYGEPSPGSGIDFTTILATIPAYSAGIITDGFGYGGYGQGGYGAAAGSYSWTSAPLSSGTWHWAVKPFDTAGERRAGFGDGRRDFRSTAFPSFVLGRDPTSLSVQPGGTNGAFLPGMQVRQREY